MKAKIDLSKSSALELLQLYGNIIDTLKAKKLVRSNNPPLGDYSESLVKDYLGLKEFPGKSNKGFDLEKKGVKYQVKSRRVSKAEETKTELSAIRNLDENKFDLMIVVIYNLDFTIKYAY